MHSVLCIVFQLARYCIIFRNMCRNSQLNGQFLYVQVEQKKQTNCMHVARQFVKFVIFGNDLYSGLVKVIDS